jgi:hypothetical protein
MSGMLYLVGGVSRSGKSILARRMLTERSVPYLPLDVVMMGFSRGLPAAGIFDRDTDPVVAAKMWPFVKAMALTLLEDGETYLFEGVQLEPAHALELLELHPGSVRACFLGYAHTTPEEKLRGIRAHGRLPNDWLQGEPEVEILSHAERMIDRSERIQQECERGGLAYFDSSEMFDAALEAAFRYLTKVSAEQPS